MSSLLPARFFSLPVLARVRLRRRECAYLWGFFKHPRCFFSTSFRTHVNTVTTYLFLCIRVGTGRRRRRVASEEDDEDDSAVSRPPHRRRAAAAAGSSWSLLEKLSSSEAGPIARGREGARRSGTGGGGDGSSLASAIARQPSAAAAAPKQPFARGATVGRRPSVPQDEPVPEAGSQPQARLPSYSERGGSDTYVGFVGF